jgi:hypothetical protein
MIDKLIDFEYKNYHILSLSKSPAKEIVIDIQPFPCIIELDSCLIPESAFECAGDDIIRSLKYGDNDGKIYTIKNCTLT